MSFTGCQLKFERPEDVRSFCVQPYSDAMSLAAVHTFGEFISRYSCAMLSAVGWSEGDLVEVGTVKAGHYACIGLYAKIFLKDEQTGKRRHVYIPAPVDNIFTEKQEVKLVIGQEVAKEFSLLTGKPFSFRHGALWGDSTP